MGVTAAGGKGFPTLSKTLKAFERIRVNKTANAIRRVITAARTDAKARVGTDGIGRRIWGRKSSGLNALIKRERLRHVGGGSFQGGLKVHGLAGLIEKGGQIAPHEIRGVGRFLASKDRGFMVSGGHKSTRRGLVAAVKHPGGPVAAKARVKEAWDAAQPRFPGEIAKALGEAMEESQRA